MKGEKTVKSALPSQEYSSYPVFIKAEIIEEMIYMKLILIV